MPDSTLRSFTAHDGSNLAVMDWPLPSGAPSRGLVVIVHGLGEHAGRYDHVAERLNSWGFAVRSYDQHGHGESDVTLDTFLNTLPQVNPAGTTTSNNPGNGGQSNIDLRGLGANRNLVLINGRRPMVSASNQTVDLNTIPQGLIERIEIVTGGAGAAYGADAIAGVVNLILKDNFEGIDLRASYSNSLPRTDAREYQFSGIIGGNFADGKGNAVFGFDRSYREAMIKSQRAFSQNATSTTSFLPEGALFWGSTNAPTKAALDTIFAGYGVTSAQTTLQSGTIGFNLDGTLFYKGIFNSPLDVRNFRYPIDGAVVWAEVTP